VRDREKEGRSVGWEGRTHRKLSIFTTKNIFTPSIA
jgi:hypothetical protein